VSSSGVVIVTGGSGGLAPGLVAALGEAGFEPVVVARDPGRLAAAAAQMTAALGREVIAIPGDVTDSEQAAAVAAAVVARFGRIDVLVNAAATSTPIGGAIETVEVDALVRDLDTKVGGYLRMIQAVVPEMKRRSFGRIINIGGLTGRSSDTLSGLRNAAVAHLTKVLADQLGGFGVTVNAVHPGIVRTPHLAALFETLARERGTMSSQVEAEFVAGIPTGRLLETLEIGRAVAFLAGADAASINGESLTVDGGYSRGVYL
jgi:NAD(P)-dependent dehydrogenase (short-subunit alcohol dehydrogenase family)